jgi:hypothetical protein
MLAISYWPFTLEARVHALGSPCGICGRQMTLGHVFLQVLHFLHVRIIPPLLYIHSCVIWGMDSGLLAAQFQRVSPYHNNNNNSVLTDCYEMYIVNYELKIIWNK